jgi:hypothetical protein
MTQTPLTPPSPQGGEGGGGNSNFGDWNLFVIWCLEFGASISLYMASGLLEVRKVR